MIYVVYWKGDFREALSSLVRRAKVGNVRFVRISKPFMIPKVLQKFDAGLNNGVDGLFLLAICVSPIVYTNNSWQSVFGVYHFIESYNLVGDDDIKSFDEWFQNASKFKGVGYVRPSSSSVEVRKSDVVVDFISDMRESFKEDADTILDLCLREVGDEFGDILSNMQDEFLLNNRRKFIKWSKLDYLKRYGRLKSNTVGMKILRDTEKEVDEFMQRYNRFYYDKEGEFSEKLSVIFRKKISDFCFTNGLEKEFLVPSRPVSLLTFREWLCNEYPKSHEKYFVLPIWDHIPLVRSTMLSRVKPYEEHLREINSKSDSGVRIIVPLKKR